MIYSSVRLAGDPVSGEARGLHYPGPSGRNNIPGGSFYADAIYVAARQRVPMDIAQARKLVVLLVTILCAYIISRFLSGIILHALGLAGMLAFMAGLILYAGIFFGVLYLFERFAGVRVF